jgi:hypothetical protein
MSIGPSDNEPISRKDYDSRPPAQESDDESAASEDEEMPTAEMADSYEEVIEGTPTANIELATTPTPNQATNQQPSPTDPYEQVQMSMTMKFESMFADMYTKMMEANKKVMQETVDATISPQLLEIKNLKAAFLSPNPKPTAPINEVHCQVSQESASKESTSKQSYASTANRSTGTSPPKPPTKPPLPKDQAPPGFNRQPQPMHQSSKQPATKSPKFSMPIMVVFLRANVSLVLSALRPQQPSRTSRKQESPLAWKTTVMFV